ncbi:MAG: hypothetical protein J6U38_04515 [Clostridia bacterium]|nr:hypothetical protein [Clostridia bacterium]
MKNPARKIIREVAAAVTAVIMICVALAGCVNPNGPDGPEPTEEPVEMRDISNDTKFAKTVVYANGAANSVQARYTDGTRAGYEVFNKNTKITQNLNTDGRLGITKIESTSGAVFAEGSIMNAYVIDANGMVRTDNNSMTPGRINTTRLGYYYYEVFTRDQEFCTPDGGDEFDKVTNLSDFDGDWSSSGDAEAIMKKGKSVTLNVVGATDPNIYKGLLTAVPKSDVTHIAVTIAAFGSGGRCQCFFVDRTSREFNARQSIEFVLACDGQPHTYLIDISSLLDDDLAGIRFDMGQIPGEKYIISSVKAVTLGGMVKAKGERTLDVYPDKIHQSFRLLASAGYQAVKEFGMVWEMPASKVKAFQARDYNGAHNDPAELDPNTVQYVAFSVKDAGTIGIIIPDDGSTLKTTVELKDGKYIVKQVAGGELNLKAGADVRFGHRLYTDETGEFKTIEKTAWLERNPLKEENFTIEEGSSPGTKFIGYDTLKGAYYFTGSGHGFDTAFRQEYRNKYFTYKITAETDSADRTIFIRMRSTPGSLECAALLDENDMLLPVPVEVCKNFDCEKEEKIYDPQDKSYGDTVFPVVLDRGEKYTFTDLHLYMNWGKYQLKQLSSIQFFVSYYHLSTGVSESNCISFYGVFGKDGFLLPDFRGHSGIRWNTDPQFTSVGRCKAVSYYDNSGNLVMPEYTGSKINCSGPSYADLEYSYVSDCGSFKYTLRHVEFPQNDENRTYYTLDLTFLKNLTLKDVRSQLNLLSQDSRNQTFSELSYIDADGNRAHVDLKNDLIKRDEVQYKLNAGGGYYAYYHSNKPVPTGKIEGEEDPMNYAIVIRSADITIGGKKWEGNFILRDSFERNVNFSALSLDLGKTTFKKGDRIRLEVIMLPWANRDLASDENVQMVYEDSVLKSQTVTAAVGTVIEDPTLPRVKCVDNACEFTVTGGRNRIVVRADGFTVLGRPVIEKKTNGGEWEPYDTSVHEFDGYQVHFLRDGTYGYSFIFEQESPDDSVSFRVKLG